MKKNVLIAAFCLIGLLADGQTGPYEKIDEDLPYAVLAAEFDNNHKLHVLCGNKDSLFIYEKRTNSWFLKSKGKNYLNEFDFNHNRFFLKEHNQIWYTVTVGWLWEGIPKPWTHVGIQNGALLDSFTGYEGQASGVVQFKDSLFILGYVASPSQVLKIKNLSFQFSNAANSSQISYISTNSTRDELLVVSDLGLLEYNSVSNSFELVSSLLNFRNTQDFIISTSDPSIVYALAGSKVYQLTNFILSDSFDIQSPQLNENRGLLSAYDAKLLEHKGDLFIHYGTTYSGSAFAGDRLYFKEGNTFKGVKTDAYLDSSISSVLVGNDSTKLFYAPIASFTHNGVDFNQAFIKSDSITTVGLDTIYVKGYLDLNSNGIFDSGDDVLPCPRYGILYKGFGGLFSSVKDYLPILIPDYEEVTIQLACSFVRCVGPDYSFYYKSRNTSLQNVKDTIEIPFFRFPDDKKEVKPYILLDRSARLFDTMEHTLTVNGSFCADDSIDFHLKWTLPPNTRFISASPMNYTKTNDDLFFQLPRAKGKISQPVKVKLVYESPAYKIGDRAIHFVELHDSNLYNSNSLLSEDSIAITVGYSYDPNVKLSKPSGVITEEVDKVRYTIHFENEGNDVARTVVVVDTIDTRMRASAFRMIGSSHPYTVTIQNNVVIWTFKNIDLAGKQEDPSKSRGYVSFEAQVNTKLAIGDSIRNKASIYFDRNDAIVTNFARVVRVDNNKSIHSVELVGNALSIYPNPSGDVFTIKSVISTTVNLEIYSLNGSLVSKIAIGPKKSLKINSSNWPKGMYILHVVEVGESIKLFKE